MENIDLFNIPPNDNRSYGITKILEPSDDVPYNPLCDQKCDECEGRDGNCRCPGDCNNDCKVSESDNENGSLNGNCECQGNCSGNGECHHCNEH